LNAKYGNWVFQSLFLTSKMDVTLMLPALPAYRIALLSRIIHAYSQYTTVNRMPTQTCFSEWIIQGKNNYFAPLHVTCFT